MQIGNMFKDNKYTKAYFKLMRGNYHGDVELHHIIPKSLGGTNEQENILPLSLKAHYIAHLLLVKMVIGSKNIHKMMHALKMMSSRGGSAKMYERMKKRYKFEKTVLCYNPTIDKTIRIFSSEQTPDGFIRNTRKPNSKEHNSKIKAAVTGRRKHVSVEGTTKLIHPHEAALDDRMVVKTQKTPHDVHGNTHRVACNDGKTEIRVHPDYIPSGFVLGRLAENIQTGRVQSAHQKKAAATSNYVEVSIMIHGNKMQFESKNDMYKFLNTNEATFRHRKASGKLYEKYGITEYNQKDK